MLILAEGILLLTAIVAVKVEIEIIALSLIHASARRHHLSAAHRLTTGLGAALFTRSQHVAPRLILVVFVRVRRKSTLLLNFISSSTRVVVIGAGAYGTTLNSTSKLHTDRCTIFTNQHGRANFNSLFDALGNERRHLVYKLHLWL